MKLKIFTTATLFGLLLVRLAHAQVTMPIQGNIPFQFQVGETVLPADEKAKHVSVIRHADGRLHAFMIGLDDQIWHNADAQAQFNSTESFRPQLKLDKRGGGQTVRDGFIQTQKLLHMDNCAPDSHIQPEMFQLVFALGPWPRLEWDRLMAFNNLRGGPALGAGRSCVIGG